MAVETWAAGNITGGPGSVSNPARQHGAYIPIQEIPNAPKGVEMPLVNYPSIPAIRHDYLQGPPDMSSRAAKLMQSPLPGSFEEANAMHGQAPVAKAIAGVGADLAKVGFAASGVLARMGRKAMEDKDDTDQLRAQKMMQIYGEKLNEIEAKFPPDQWAAEKQKIDKQFAEDLSPLGVTQLTRDKIQVSGQAVMESANYRMSADSSLRSMRNDQEFAATQIEQAREKGDWRGADAGVALMHKIGAYNDDMAKLQYDKNTFLQQKQAVDEALKLPGGAHDVKAEAEKSLKGGKSDFALFNDNPNLRANYLYQATEKAKEDERAASAELKSRMEAGDVTMKTDKDIAEFGKKNHLPDYLVKSFQHAAKVNPANDPARHVDVRDAISKYNYYADSDGTDYHRITAMIQTTIDKDHQSVYEGMLDAKMKKGVAGEPEKAQEIEHARVVSMIKEQDDAALLVKKDMRRDLISARQKMKDAENEKREAKLTPAEAAAYHENARGVLDMMNSADTYMKDHPDFKQGELMQSIFQDHPTSKNLEKNAGTTVAAPRAVPVNVSGPPTREQLSAARGLPLPPEAVPPRNLNTRSGGPEFQAAMVSEGDRTIGAVATAYTPGKGDRQMEGKNEVSGREGKAYMFEDYAEGRVPYVSVAMDEKSKWQGEYLISTTHPNVVFKVEDHGPAFEGKGETRIDIAYRNESFGKNYKTSGTWKVISPEEARNISGQLEGSIGATALDKSTREKIAKMVPAARPQAIEFMTLAQALAKSRGLSLEITSGTRTAERQAQLHASGQTPATAQGSRHVKGRAWDIGLFRDGKYLEPRQNGALYQQFGNLGKSIGLRWGGDFQSFYDPMHFDTG